MFSFMMIFLLAPAVQASDEAPAPAETTAPEESTTETSSEEQSQSSEEGQSEENGSSSSTDTDPAEANENPTEVVDEPVSTENEESDEVENSEESAEANEDSPEVVNESAPPENAEPEQVEIVEEPEEPTNPETAAPVETEDEEEEQPAQPSDPYFFVGGTKHSFLPSSGSCEGVDNCTTSTTPISDALSAVSGGMTPDDNTIYVEGGIFEEDIRISEFSDLTFQGSANDQPSVLAGNVEINNSHNISLLHFVYEEILGIANSSEISILGTDADDEIELELQGNVENLSVDGGEGDDSITLNLEAENGSVTVTDSGEHSNDSLVIRQDDDTQISEGQVSSEHETVSYDDTIENLEVDSQEDIDVQGDTTIADKLTLTGKNLNIEADLSAKEISLRSLVTTYVSGSLYAANKEVDQIGGPIYVLGHRVVLAEDAYVTASGDAGGGNIYIGGDYLGQGELPTAAFSFVGPDVIIEANALNKGDGGRVIVWSDNGTLFYGQINALGGILGGDGGFIETSGKDYLEVTGSSVSAGAPLGTAGTWLLDPHNVEIKNVANSTGGTFAGTNPKTFTPNFDDAVVDTDDIENALSSGTSVTITTGSTGSQDGNIKISSAVDNNLVEATLRLEAAKNIETSAPLSSNGGKYNIIFIADSDNNGSGAITLNQSLNAFGGDISLTAAGTVTINHEIHTHNGGIAGDVRIEGSNIVIHTTNGKIKTVDTGASGAITLEPSSQATAIDFGGGTGTFSLGDAELERIDSEGTVTIGRIDGTGSVFLDSLIELPTRKFDLIIYGGPMDFSFNLELNANNVQLYSNGDIKSTGGGAFGRGVKITNTGVGVPPHPQALGLDAKGDIDLDTEVGTIAAQITSLGANAPSGSVKITNTGGLTVGAVGTIEGITGYGGITVIATSPLTVNRALREKAGGDINLTAGNDSTVLGDDLTITAEVTVEGGGGSITGNAGDNINHQANALASAPGGVNFNAGLDGDADNAGGNATINGNLTASGHGKHININAPNGISQGNTSTITTQGGNLTLQAVNGHVARTGLIFLNGGQLLIIQLPPPPGSGAGAAGSGTASTTTTGTVLVVGTGVGVGAAGEDGSGQSNSSDSSLTTALAANTVLVIASGQQVDLLEALALGSSITLQLPEGDGATFITGIPAVVAMFIGDDVVLPADLPPGFDLLSSLNIDVDQNDPESSIGELLVSFESPNGFENQNLVILHWSEEDGWVEIDLEDTANGKIEALAEEGGFFVLAAGEAQTPQDETNGAEEVVPTVIDEPEVAEVNGSIQTPLNGQNGEDVTIPLPQGNQLVISPDAGDNVLTTPVDSNSLPGTLPAGFTPLSSLSVEVNANGSGVNILPSGETMQVQFALPEGLTIDEVSVMMWVPTANGGQGGWTEIPSQLSSDGSVVVDIFIGGTFVLASK